MGNYIFDKFETHFGFSNFLGLPPSPPSKIRCLAKIRRKIGRCLIANCSAHRPPTNLHIIPNVGSINPIKYVLSPNRNPQNCIFSPTLGPKGPQKPSKLHISSKSWQHISNKNIHPPNDGIIYPIFLTILTIFENFDNFAKLDFDEFFKIILPSKSRL